MSFKEKLTPSCFAGERCPPKRFFADGFPLGPNMRMRLGAPLIGFPVALAAFQHARANAFDIRDVSAAMRSIQARSPRSSAIGLKRSADPVEPVS